MIFDARTGFLFVSALHLLIAVALWAVLARRRTLALDLWCGGGAVFAVALLLLSLRPLLPAVLGYTLATLLVIVAALLKLHAIRLELGEPEPVARSIALVLAFLLLYEWLRVDADERLRFFVMMLVVMLLGARIAWSAWRLGRRPGCRSAYWIAVAHGAMVLVQAIRAGNVALGRFPPELMSQGYDALMFAMILLIAVIMANMAWLGLALERLVQAQIAAAAAQARSEETRVLGERIAHLERQRSLGLLSASLGHELKQPLTAVLTNAQLVRRGLAGARLTPDQLLGFVDRIIDNTRRASGIVEQIRGYLRPGSAAVGRVDLGQVVREVSELVAAEARAHGVRLSLELPADPVTVRGDALQLSQVVLNLLRNAIEAAAGHAAFVSVRAVQGDGRALLTVEDGGPGLTPAALQKAGQPFFTTKAGGLGLGLSISRAIAEQHGGTLRLANAPAGGARAELDLPSCAEPPAAAG
jgi:signal transduction histidine kinase